MSIKNLYTAAMALLFGCQTSPSHVKRIYLIPMEYTGEIKIMYDEPDGVELKELDGEIKYPINADGTLKVKDSQVMGVVNDSNTSFHYSGKNGQETIIPFNSDKLNDPDEIVVRGPYRVNKKSYFFIDRKSEIKKYKNPAINNEEKRG